MTNAKQISESVDLNLDTDYLEKATVSLIREYLARKGYRDSLATFDEEYPNKENSLASRSKLIEYLSAQRLYEKNKTLAAPFKTVLELLISYHSAVFKNSISNTTTTPTTKPKTVKEMDSRGLGKSKRNVCTKDLQIDDANEGELYEESDKRLAPTKSSAESFDLGLKLNKLKPFTETKKPEVAVKQETKLEVKPSKSSFLSELTTRTKSPDEQRLKPEKSQPQQKPSLFSNVYDSKIVTGQTRTLDSSLKGSALNPSEFTTRPIDYETATKLRMLLFGTVNQSFPDEWKQQGFPFCELAKLKFGIVQTKGGPCGVLASVQAYVIQELVFCNETASPQTDTHAIFNPNKRERSCALAKGLARLLWKAGDENREAVVAVKTNKANFAPVGKYKSDGITETLNLLTFDSQKSLEGYLLNNINLFEPNGSHGCILLLYSAIFSRTIEKIITDMDEKTNKLMGMHGYCTQDMVNLLIHGRAVSNVFNDSIFLDSLELRGPNKRNEIGLLSLFEHYKSCEVGSYYKTPKYPIWVVCSESHFSVIFSLKLDILSDWRAEKKFDMFYYDGLAKQDEQIRLTLTSVEAGSGAYGFDDSFFKMLNKGKGTDKDLTPPLELVLKTKWKDISVDWNSTTPLL